MCGVWSEHWQAGPPPLQTLQQCTHTSISQTQPLDMMLSTCTQLLWSTMARPFWVEPVLLNRVWSWPLRCSSVSGSWQSSYSLRHLNVGQQFFFQILREFFAIRCHVELPWPVWESESDNTKFNTPAPHSHLRPCNTNESHDTGERKWRKFGHFHFGVYSLLWPVV